MIIRYYDYYCQFQNKSVSLYPTVPPLNDIANLEETDARLGDVELLWLGQVLQPLDVRGQAVTKVLQMDWICSNVSYSKKGCQHNIQIPHERILLWLRAGKKYCLVEIVAF